VENAGALSERESRRAGRLDGSRTREIAGSRSSRACSNCPGDYEDPDRTAWTEGEDIEPDEDEAEDDRFPKE
jgi:hypothetical protein